MNGGPHILYRCFNADGELLYIGLTNDIDNRLRQHSQSAAWWHEFDSHTEDDSFGDRWTLERAERAAIIAEEPLYNVSYSMGARAVQIEYERSKIRAAIVEELFRTASATPPAESDEPRPIEADPVALDESPEAESLWLTRADLSERLNGIPEETLAYWARTGRGPRSAKFGRHVRYRLSDVIAWEDEKVGGAA